MAREEYLKEEEFSPLKSILSLMSFSTIFPINIFTSMEYLTKLTWFWPFIHLFVGILAAVCGFICHSLLQLDLLLSSAIIYAFLMIITGYNHVDGLMDMSDGVMVHGDASRKISIMKDSSVGTAGIMSAILVSLIAIAAISDMLSYNFILGIIIIEMSSKTSLLTTAITSKAGTGLGSYFINSLNVGEYMLSTFVVAVISYLLGGVIGLLGVLGAIISGAVMSIIAKKNFGIANGDVLGASNEVGRVISAIFICIGLFYFM